ncbi:hypothetical protein [Herbiconiux sp. L3-i23]|uniref:hypothetical protein n=1 Tax=Herbiconiux sp. L3-i23 TaxID=2905871 RepID=UPI00204A3AA1|nr:hypothetical protein [Herbiconiux sp. L3-i23]BDI23530.1 hypothetical protein L3i23_23060 [Herbiconiux sp. L3-i23]
MAAPLLEAPPRGRVTALIGLGLWAAMVLLIVAALTVVPMIAAAERPDPVDAMWRTVSLQVELLLWVVPLYLASLGFSIGGAIRGRSRISTAAVIVTGATGVVAIAAFANFLIV